MITETYNGWTNYATWRVNLEFEPIEWVKHFSDEELKDMQNTINHIKTELEDYIIDTSSGLSQDYALAFVSEVNWNEIYNHIMEDLGLEVE